jgi:hypothetical protein
VRVAIVAIASLLVPAVATPKSLGDAAREEAKKRAGQALLVRSYSAADLSSPGVLSNPDATPPDALGATEAAPTAARKATPEEALRAQLDREQQEREQQEARWRGLARAALAEVEQAQSELEDCRLNGG